MSGGQPLWTTIICLTSKTANEWRGGRGGKVTVALPVIFFSLCCILQENLRFF